MTDNASTKNSKYTKRLLTKSNMPWKKLIGAQVPYHWNIRRLKLGRVLDVGCGIGRNMGSLSSDSLGVDHNAHSISIAKKAGFNAMLAGDFIESKFAQKNTFDSMLLAHVLEHMSSQEGEKIIKTYLPYVKSNVVVICPQKKGFTTDETHVNFLESSDIQAIMRKCGLDIVKSYSFPFHKKAGDFFTYNETVVIGRKRK